MSVKLAYEESNWYFPKYQTFFNIFLIFISIFRFAAYVIKFNEVRNINYRVLKNSPLSSIIGLGFKKHEFF